MKILVLNCGSSSVKYQLMDMEGEEVLARGVVERVGIDGAFVNHQTHNDIKEKIEAKIPNHSVAIKLVIETLLDERLGVIKDLGEISAVGHRVVHGGEKFAGSVLIDDEVMAALRECIDLAPLHNPPNIMGIEACQELMPEVPQVGVFDTAFHQSMPETTFIYGLPYEYYKKYGIRRYGFHGTSHKYVSRKAAELMDRDYGELKIITCHLGNGASIAAIDGGKVVDTSMGLTPLEGLVMGTRCGDIDPAIVPLLMQKEELSPSEIDTIMNKKSGLLGISGISNDSRDIEEAADEGNNRAKLALDIFRYRVKKYIGSYAAALGGVDCIVFTAGIGENAIETRAEILSGLEFLGVKVDQTKNNVRGKAQEISTEDSRVKAYVIPTNEELVIAQDTSELAG
ncbi:MAG: acetate kinase [Halanaerobium sp.]|nr:acetate kinase [Halanaerobium sp.]